MLKWIRAVVGDDKVRRVDAWMKEAYGRHGKGEVEKAEALYRRILEVDPDNADALYLLGEICRGSGRNEEAIERIGKAIGVNGGVAAFYFGLGCALQAAERYREAEASYRRALELNGGDAEAWTNLGVVEEKLGRMEAAEADYRRALELNPELAPAHYNLGKLLKAEGRFAQAIEHYEAALHGVGKNKRERPMAPDGPDRIREAVEECGEAAPRLTGVSRCAQGVMLYLRNDMYIGRSLALYREFSEGEVDLFRRILVPGDVVVEAGANVGAHTLFLARAVGQGGIVHAYEPQRIVFQILCANLALNGIANVYSRQLALGSTAGAASVPLLDYGSENNFGGVELGAVGGEQVAVETVDSLGLGSLRLLKADVEGFEAEVIKGAADTIRRLRPILYVENDRAEKSSVLISLIQDFGYRLWWHLPPLYNPDNYAGNRENVFGNIVSINMLCVPAERPCGLSGLREIHSPGDSWRMPGEPERAHR